MTEGTRWESAVSANTMLRCAGLLFFSCVQAATTPALEVDAGQRVVEPTPTPATPEFDPNKFLVWGIDVSHHQHRIDWPKVAAQPRMRFAFLKATQGRTFIDSEFKRNWRGARSAGLRIGAYHYFSFCSGAEEQAKHFLSVVPAAKDALPAVLDVEHLMNCPTNADPEVTRGELVKWLTVVEQATGRRPIVYATVDVLEEFFLDREPSWPLWVRRTPEDPEPVLELPWQFLQYDDQHGVEGIEGPVDHDVFGGDLRAFSRLTSE